MFSLFVPLLFSDDFGCFSSVVLISSICTGDVRVKGFQRVFTVPDWRQSPVWVAGLAAFHQRRESV